MQSTSSEKRKSEVHDYWNQQSCGTQVARSEKFSRDYFEEIERFRYFDQPFIHSFAQFSRYHGKKVLEVGFGAGTDFVQWLRAGARASGIDLTEEALLNLTRQIDLYKLPSPEAIHIGDAEHLPFPDDTFDLGYSFGVLHHTPNTDLALQELVRVIKPGGELKVMLYNRRSIYIFSKWIQHALLRGRPWKNLNWVLWHHMESIGTKGYTRSELLTNLSRLPLHSIAIHTEVTSADWLAAQGCPPLNWLFRQLVRRVGHSHQWFLEDYFDRVTDAPGRVRDRTRSSPRLVVRGSPFGFFHCISARKVGNQIKAPATD